jgi:hypothetical protein
MAVCNQWNKIEYLMGFVIGIAIGTLYLIFCGILQHRKSEERRHAIEDAEFAWISAKGDSEKARNEMLSAIADVYGKEKAIKVDEGTIWEGMPSHLLLAARGGPEDTKEGYFKGKRTERWYYDAYATRLGTVKYKLELILENDALVGWKDLD